jgi:hypothetical protein
MTLGFADSCPFNLRTPALAHRVRYTTSPSAQTTRVCAWGRGVSAPLLSHLRTRCVACARSRGFLLSSSAHVRRECAHRAQLALPPCPPVLGLMSGSVAVVCCRRAACVCISRHSTAVVVLGSYLSLVPAAFVAPLRVRLSSSRALASSYACIRLLLALLLTRCVFVLSFRVLFSVRSSLVRVSRGSFSARSLVLFARSLVLWLHLICCR